MKSSADTPIYNLKAVVQETGLKPDTLRAWERRYGLPEPQRTDSGHRLYSTNDIELLKWLMARQDEGMSISRAVELWRRLQAEYADPRHVLSLHNTLQQSPPPNAVATLNQPEPPPAFAAVASHPDRSHPEGGTLAHLRDSWITSCINFDEQTAEQILTQAFALFPAETICIELVQKGLAAIGQGWYEGKVTVQQEHFASALANRRLEALLLATPLPTRQGRILIGCPPDEAHTFVPLLLTLLLRRRGWDVMFLGANVPIQDFISTVQSAQPRFVILTAQLLATAVGIRELGELIYEANLPMGYGGLIFTQLPELQGAITGHYLGHTIPGAIDQIEGLMRKPRLPHPVPSLAPQQEEVLTQFRLHQAWIEAELWRTYGSNGAMPHDLLRKANINFGRDILAALSLGNIRYLGVDLPWIRGLLMNHYQIPESLITAYLHAYLRSTEIVLGERGTILSDWLADILRQDEQRAAAP